jgi:hypothetical protein
MTHSAATVGRLHGHPSPTAFWRDLDPPAGHPGAPEKIVQILSQKPRHWLEMTEGTHSSSQTSSPTCTITCPGHEIHSRGWKRQPSRDRSPAHRSGRSAKCSLALRSSSLAEGQRAGSRFTGRPPSSRWTLKCRKRIIDSHPARQVR